MKKLTLAALLFPALMLVPACSVEEVEAKGNKAQSMAKDAIDSIDFSALSPDALKAKYDEFSGVVTKELATINDAATAENAKKVMEPVVDGLTKMKKALGDKMPSMDSMKSTFDNAKTKFADNPEVMKVLQPTIDKLKALFE